MAATTRGDATTPVHQRLAPWLLVTETYWMSYKLLERRLYHLAVSASQARVLAVLHFADGPVKPSHVALLLFQETQSITGIVHRLEARGWVERRPDPDDRRAVGLRLTESGRKVSEEVVRISEELYGELFAPALGAAERRAVETALRKVRAHGFTLPETDFKLRRAQRYALWRD